MLFQHCTVSAVLVCLPLTMNLRLILQCLLNPTIPAWLILRCMVNPTRPAWLIIQCMVNPTRPAWLILQCMVNPTRPAWLILQFMVNPTRPAWLILQCMVNPTRPAWLTMQGLVNEQSGDCDQYTFCNILDFRHIFCHFVYYTAIHFYFQLKCVIDLFCVCFRECSMRYVMTS